MILVWGKGLDPTERKHSNHLKSSNFWTKSKASTYENFLFFFICRLKDHNWIKIYFGFRRDWFELPGFATVRNDKLVFSCMNPDLCRQGSN